MKVKSVMSSPVHSISAQQSIFEAAKLMDSDDVGVLPVVDDDELVGIVTDRDIIVRAVANGSDLDDVVATIMTRTVETCRPDDDVDDALAQMGDAQVRRLPVVDNYGSVIGVLSIGDVARTEPDDDDVAEALGEICTPTPAFS